MTTTHAKLVKLAAKWLEQHGHVVVVTELGTVSGEQPDAMGFTYRGETTVIECKASRADFRADAKKESRTSSALGQRRYFLAPYEIIAATELPTDWGLLVVKAGRVRERVSPQLQPTDKQKEMRVLISLLRRLGVHKDRGTYINIYTMEKAEGEARATLGVKEEDPDG